MANNFVTDFLTSAIHGLHNFAFGNQAVQQAAQGAPQGQPVGPAPNPPSPGPAPAPQGGGANPILAKISGLLGGGNPLEDQKNAYVKGAVDSYMAQNGKRLTGKNAPVPQAPTRKTAQPQPDPSGPYQQIFHSVISKLFQ